LKKLLVGSVYAPSERNLVWRNLQRHYLDRTVGAPNYDQVVWLNRVPAELFEGTGATVLGDWGPPTRTQIDDHCHGLNSLLDYFREARNRYEHFIIIDSDAFPFRANWLEKLLYMMQARRWPVPGPEKAERALPERFIAGVVQAEMMNVYFHPATVFIRGEALRADPNCIEFGPQVLRDLLGIVFRELTFTSKVPVLPLVRTNFWNPHPMVAGVYADIIYHHAAGSHQLMIRSADAGYWDHYIPREAHNAIQNQLYSALVSNPDGFLEHLTGGNRFGLP
jgi:hypothetical protein